MLGLQIILSLCPSVLHSDAENMDRMTSPPRFWPLQHPCSYVITDWVLESLAQYYNIAGSYLGSSLLASNKENRWGSHQGRPQVIPHFFSSLQHPFSPPGPFLSSHQPLQSCVCPLQTSPSLSSLTAILSLPSSCLMTCTSWDYNGNWDCRDCRC